MLFIELTSALTPLELDGTGAKMITMQNIKYINIISTVVNNKNV